MNTVRGLASVAALAVITACAGTPPPTEVAMIDGQMVEKECRRVETMGSNLGRRVCLFPAGWEAYEEQIDRSNEETRRRTEGNKSHVRLQGPAEQSKAVETPVYD